MKIKNKTIQLFLISLGFLLILSTYFLYPRIVGENKTGNLTQNKTTLPITYVNLYIYKVIYKILCLVTCYKWLVKSVKIV